MDIIDVHALASAQPARHYRATLTVDLQYLLRKPGTTETIDETQFKRTLDGLQEYPTRRETFQLLWHARHDDPFSFLGEERIGKRITQLDELIAKEDIATAIRDDMASFHAEYDTEQRFYTHLRRSLAARAFILEQAGHKVTMDIAERVRFEPGTRVVRVRGASTEPSPVYVTGKPSYNWPKIQNLEKAKQLVNKEYLQDFL